MLESLLSPVVDIVNNTIDKFVPDAGERERLKSEITKQVLMDNRKELETKASIVLAEAQGESWIQRTWRPILMLWFAALIGMYWFGFTAENLPEEVIERLFMIMQYGLSGYIIGRSGEKIMREYVKK